MVALSGAMEMCGNVMEKWRRRIATSRGIHALLVPSSEKKAVDHMKTRMRIHDIVSIVSLMVKYHDNILTMINALL